MQRKSYAYMPGIAVLLTALLAGCSGGAGADDGTDDSKPGEVSSSVTAAKPGKYRSLPEPCGQPDKSMLDTMLPGIKELPDAEQQEKAYKGSATSTYDTDRRAGCTWKDDSAESGAHRLSLDFERVVSYDSAVSDDARAESVYAAKETAADLPEPSPSSGSSDSSGSSGSSGSSEPPESPSSSTPTSTSSPSSPSSPTSPSSSVDAAEVQPRTLDDLGDEAFVDDALSGSGTSQRRTVTVVFRTSNVVVTLRYEAQSAVPGEAPDSKEMQDTARELAGKLVGKFGE
ncbi:DUF3558 domain-containing protein [Streptomyces sp. NPDC050095]|uniref:DUF3558 domain-containing protein n=1 Tax=unclassified Streptomyces TaxID=2593676 RepID=UPI003418B6D4